MENVSVVAVVSLISREFLLIRRTSEDPLRGYNPEDDYAFVSETCEDGDEGCFRTCASRGLKEELDFSVDPDDLVFLNTTPREDSEKGLISFYLCAINKPTDLFIKQFEEVTEHKWVSEGELSHYLSHYKHKKDAYDLVSDIQNYLDDYINNEISD